MAWPASVRSQAVLCFAVLLCTHLIVQLALIHVSSLASPQQRADAQLCLQPRPGSNSTLLVLVPLLATNRLDAATELQSRLDVLLRLAPCRPGVSPAPVNSSQPSLVVATAVHDAIDVERLASGLMKWIKPAARCFSTIELRSIQHLRSVFDAADVPNGFTDAASAGRSTSSPRQQRPSLENFEGQRQLNDAFLGAFALARQQRKSLLWLAPEAVPLRKSWLELMACEAAASAGAWLVGSTLLMDCRQRWAPSAACCARGDPQQLPRHLSATGLYAAQDRGLFAYVTEWSRSTLNHVAFNTALSTLVWTGYHEARQRTLHRRFVATQMILDFGEQAITSEEALIVEPRAALLQTRNCSLPIGTSSIRSRGQWGAGSTVENWWVLPDDDGKMLPSKKHNLPHDLVPVSIDHGNGASVHGISTGASDSMVESTAPGIGPSDLGDPSALIAAARRQVGPGQKLMITFAWPSVSHALNQLLWFDRLNITNFLLVTLDVATHSRMCRTMNAACALAPAAPFADVSRQSVAGTTANTMRIARCIGTILAIAKLGMHVFASSADSLLLRNPWRDVDEAFGLINQWDAHQSRTDTRFLNHASAPTMQRQSATTSSQPAGPPSALPRDIILLKATPFCGNSNELGEADDDGDGTDVTDEGDGESSADQARVLASSSLATSRCVSTEVFAVRAGARPALAFLTNLAGRLIGMPAERLANMSFNYKIEDRPAHFVKGEESLIEPSWKSMPKELGLPQNLSEALAGALHTASANGLQWSLFDSRTFCDYTQALHTMQTCSAAGPPAALNLITTSSAADAHTKAYLLRELCIWLLDAVERPDSDVTGSSWIGYDVTQADCPLNRQRGALRSALIMSEILHRALVLPRFCMMADDSSPRVPLSYFFDYSAFSTAFPAHGESAIVHRLPSRSATFHISLSEGQTHKGNVTASFRARTPKGATEGQIRGWMKKHSSKPLIWFDRLFHRLNKLDDLQQQGVFDAKLRAGLRPAPHLRSVIAAVVQSLATKGKSSQFNCLQVSLADMAKNGEKLFMLASRVLPTNEPTLFVDSSLSNQARLQMQDRFSAPRFLSDMLPSDSRHLFEDEEGHITLAYELVEVHVCAASQTFVGNMLTPYAQHVCYERGGVLASPNNGIEGRKECADLYERDEATIKASKFGRGLF